MLPNVLFSILALTGSVLGAPVDGALSRRAVVNHDSLNPLPEKVRDSAVGQAIARFNPLLHIAHGCQPYTAVNEAGDTSGGLKPSGSSSGACRDTGKGQVYARGAWHEGKYAIMYAWYFPKDMPTSGVSTGAHRHDWENTVVWLNNPAVENPTILGAAASGHGNYKRTTSPHRDGDRVKVEYFTEFPTNHELQFTGTTGRTYPVLDWDVMTDAMRNALAWTDFGKANVPFKDGMFESNLDHALI